MKHVTSFRHVTIYKRLRASSVHTFKHAASLQSDASSGKLAYGVRPL
ncbi:hypothetical protein [Paenibacillus ihbetae]|nr:hypothetical protein [Paenibacillus ihbetae]